MISSNDFRTGTSIELDGAVWRVVEFLHEAREGLCVVRTLGAGRAATWWRRTSALVRWSSSHSREDHLQHTYMEGEDYVFMDMSTYEETRLIEADR